MRIDQIAINAISTAEAPVDELLRAYADAGFRNVEFPLGRVKAWMAETGRTVADLKSLLDAHGLRCVGGFEAHVIAFGDERAAAENHALHVANARLLDALGGGVLVVGTDGPADPRGRSVDALDRVGRTLASLAEQMPATVSVAVEFNWSPLVRSLNSAHRAVRAADHPRVGILFDPAHFHCTPSKLADLTPEVVRRILHVHVDDMRDVPGDLADCNADRVLPGAGVLDLPAILGRIESLGYAGCFSVELFNADVWRLTVDEAARQCYAAIRALASPRPA